MNAELPQFHQIFSHLVRNQLSHTLLRIDIRIIIFLSKKKEKENLPSHCVPLNTDPDGHVPNLSVLVVVGSVVVVEGVTLVGMVGMGGGVGIILIKSFKNSWRSDRHA